MSIGVGLGVKREILGTFFMNIDDNQLDQDKQLK